MINTKNLYSKGDKRRRNNKNVKDMEKMIWKVGSSIITSPSKRNEGGQKKLTYYPVNDESDSNVFITYCAYGMILCPIIGVIIGLVLSSWTAFLYIGIGGLAISAGLGALYSIFSD